MLPFANIQNTWEVTQVYFPGWGTAAKWVGEGHYVFMVERQNWNSNLSIAKFFRQAEASQLPPKQKKDATNWETSEDSLPPHLVVVGASVRWAIRRKEGPCQKLPLLVFLIFWSSSVSLSAPYSFLLYTNTHTHSHALIK